MCHIMHNTYTPHIYDSIVPACAPEVSHVPAPAPYVVPPNPFPRDTVAHHVYEATNGVESE